MHSPRAILIRENKPTISGKMSLSTTRKHSSRMRIAHFGGHHYMSVPGGKYLVYLPPGYIYPQIPTSLGIPNPLDIYPLPWVYLTPWIPTPSPMDIPNPLDTYPLSHGYTYLPWILPPDTYPQVYLPLGVHTPIYLPPWFAYPPDTYSLGIPTLLVCLPPGYT